MIGHWRGCEKGDWHHENPSCFNHSGSLCGDNNPEFGGCTLPDCYQVFPARIPHPPKPCWSSGIHRILDNAKNPVCTDSHALFDFYFGHRYFPFQKENRTICRLDFGALLRLFCRDASSNGFSDFGCGLAIYTDHQSAFTVKLRFGPADAPKTLPEVTGDFSYDQRNPQKATG